MATRQAREMEALGAETKCLWLVDFGSGYFTGSGRRRLEFCHRHEESFLEGVAGIY